MLPIHPPCSGKTTDFLYGVSLYTVIVPFIITNRYENYSPVVTMDSFSAPPPLSIREKGTLYSMRADQTYLSGGTF